MNKIKYALILVIGFIIVSSIFWMFFVEPDQISVKKVNLTISRWHKESNNMKIAVLSDIHAGAPHIDLEKLDKLIETTNNQKPDLILLLGDYVIDDVFGGKFIPPEIVAKKLSRLKAPKGIVAILGNHDWSCDGHRVRKCLESNKIKVLENDSLEINHCGKCFCVAGVGDLWSRAVKVDEAIKNVRGNTPIILLSHNPHVFPKVPSRVDLTLAGHTHGCQACFPLWGRVKAHSFYGNLYAIGHIVENKHDLFVSCGIGTSCIPIRLKTRPEILILHLKGKLSEFK